MGDLEQQVDELYFLYCRVKSEVRSLDKYLFERWKAGGYLIDEDIISGYPNLSQVLEILKDSGLVKDSSQDDEEDCDKPLSEKDLGTNY